MCKQVRRLTKRRLRSRLLRGLKSQKHKKRCYGGWSGAHTTRNLATVNAGMGGGNPKTQNVFLNGNRLFPSIRRRTVKNEERGAKRRDQKKSGSMETRGTLTNKRGRFKDRGEEQRGRLCSEGLLCSAQKLGIEVVLRGKDRLRKLDKKNKTIYQYYWQDPESLRGQGKGIQDSRASRSRGGESS